MKDIRGKITIDTDRDHNLTCCDTRPCVQIDGKDLMILLKEAGELDRPESSEMEENPDAVSKNVRWAIRYVIRDEPLGDNESFERAVAGVLYSEVVRGCYSEWTCGVGGYDFVINGTHSIFNELASHDGKHLWLKLV